MKTYKLKSKEYEIEMPSLCFGTADFDDISKQEIYFSRLDKYVECGGSCIDTARVYCSFTENGADVSETVVGNWMEERRSRDKIIISTKGGHPPFEDMSRSRLSKEELDFDLSRSLECLKTDFVDIYFLHRDDKDIPVEEIMPILNEYVKQKKVRFLGASNWSTDRIEEANKYALKAGLEPFRISQINYSLAHTSADMFEDPTLECMDLNQYIWYRDNNFPVMAFSPQAKGFFTRIAEGASVKNITEGRFVSTANLARLARVKQYCEKTGLSPAVVTLGYLNSHEFPVTSVFTAGSLEHIAEDMTAQDLKFDYRTVAFLENTGGII